MTKSFTDIEQSKKLTEILPIESADMSWVSCDNGRQKYYQAENRKIILNYEKTHWLPCWSLSALYSILPNNKKETTTLSRGGWKIEPIEYLDNWWCEYEDENHTKDFTVSADNPIDACYEMIELLHEQKLL